MGGQCPVATSHDASNSPSLDMICHPYLATREHDKRVILVTIVIADCCRMFRSERGQQDGGATDLRAVNAVALDVGDDPSSNRSGKAGQ